MIMKGKALFVCTPALITVLFAAAFSFSQRNPDERITAMNPAVANRLAERLPLAPRMDTLEGKTIYMVDINWGGPEAALSIFEEMQAWFSRNMPGVRTVIKMKKGGYEADDPALWKEIQEQKGNAAILGVSG
jgi:hypothetical protein